MTHEQQVRHAALMAATNMGHPRALELVDYFAHYIETGEKSSELMPSGFIPGGPRR